MTISKIVVHMCVEQYFCPMNTSMGFNYARESYLLTTYPWFWALRTSTKSCKGAGTLPTPGGIHSSKAEVQES